MQQASSFVQERKYPTPSCNLSSYSAFIPNEAIEELTPSQAIVYATIQFLAFFSQKITPATINKRLTGMSRGTIRNAFFYLTKNEYLIVENGEFFFKNHKQDRSKNYLCARELSAIHKGYWLPLSALGSYRLKPIDKIVLGFIMSLTHKKEKKIDTSFIAKKLNITNRLASRSINALLDNVWIKRARKNSSSSFTYHLGEVLMSRSRPQHPFSIAENLSYSRDENEECHEIDTPKCHEIDIHSNNISNINNKYCGNLEETDSIAYTPSKNNSLFFLKSLVDYVDNQVAKLERERIKAKEALKRLDDEYLAACEAHDYKKMVDMRQDGCMSLKQLKLDAAERSLEMATQITENHLRATQGCNSLYMTSSDIQRVGKGVKAILPDFDSPIVRKKAFCVLMNSVLYDLQLEFQQVLVKTDWRMQSREKVAMQQAISRCLKRASGNRYRINEKVAIGYYDKAKETNVIDHRWMN